MELKSDVEIEKLHDKLVSLRGIVGDNYTAYKTALSTSNAVFNSSNKRYFTVKEKFKLNEESRITFTKYHYDKITRTIEQIYKAHKTTYSDLHSSTIEINVENDMNIHSNKVNYYVYKNNTRIPTEEFESYDVYRRNIEALINKNKMYLQKESKNAFTSLCNTFDVFGKEFGVKVDNKYCFTMDESKFIESIFLDEEVNYVQFDNLNRKISNNITYAKDFIDKLLEYYTKLFMIRIPNEDNFQRLCALVLSAFCNEALQRKVFEINFAIVYLAEKTFYQSNINPFYKVYLCKLLASKNKDIRSKEYWMKLLQSKIEIELHNKTKLQVKERLNLSSTHNDNESQHGFGVLKNVIKITGIFSSASSTQGESDMKEEELYKDIYKHIRHKETINITKDFVAHFACFNVELSDVMDILTHVSFKYEFSNDEKRMKYIIALVNSNMFSIKNAKIALLSHNGCDISSIDTKCTSSSHNEFMNRNYLSKIANKNPTTSIILNSMKYLHLAEMSNLLLLNKQTSQTISSALYQHLLLNTSIANTTAHIAIWKKLLSSSDVTRRLSYKSIQASIQHTSLPIFDIINLDILRTHFVSDEQAFQAKIKRILYSLALTHPGINYYQGMNYIAAFLITYTNNEEETFNIFSLLLDNTDYSDLFANELKRMNKYFYVVDRLICLYLPEVFTHLKLENVSVAYYASPWFVTLFTNALNYVDDDEHNKPDVLIWIFDRFVCDGWKAVIKVGMCLMKHFENRIINLKYEELLAFLVNDIIKYDFFQNGNIDKVKKLYNGLHIETCLIENIENEH